MVLISGVGRALLREPMGTPRLHQAPAPGEREGIESAWHPQGLAVRFQGSQGRVMQVLLSSQRASGALLMPDLLALGTSHPKFPQILPAWGARIFFFILCRSLHISEPWFSLL